MSELFVTAIKNTPSLYALPAEVVMNIFDQMTCSHDRREYAAYLDSLLPAPYCAWSSWAQLRYPDDYISWMQVRGGVYSLCQCDDCTEAKRQKYILAELDNDGYFDDEPSDYTDYE